MEPVRPAFTELIPGLPDEIALECLNRTHYSVHEAASHVCRRWRRLFQSKQFYYTRKKTGFTKKACCFVQSIPVQSGSPGSNSKPDNNQPKYGLSVYEPDSNTWFRVDPVPNYPTGLPLFCRVESTEGKIVIMGGWNPSNWEPLLDVFVYEFTTRRWTRRLDMPSNRSFFAAGACAGKVYVAGGHDENKNALKSAWVYDVDSDEWAELTRMSEERDECEGVVVGSEFRVVSGYGTENQGRFMESVEVLDVRTGAWRRVEEGWGASRCPRGCVAVGQNGNLRCWGESDSDPGIQVGACGVDLGDRVMVTGSAYQGAAQAFFVAEKKEGQNGKLRKVEVPDEFSGFVQSGCFVEI